MLFDSSTLKETRLEVGGYVTFYGDSNTKKNLNLKLLDNIE
jgi:hypothetical protein